VPRNRCGTRHSRVTERGRPRNACGACALFSEALGGPGGDRVDREEAGQVALPGSLRVLVDQAAVWVKTRPKVQLVPWSA
jgi:hypothetical protein